MKVFNKCNLNENYLDALNECLSISTEIESRNGNVFDIGPSTFELTGETINLLTLSGRGLNPFFALAEAAWVLDGDNALEKLNYYIADYGKYSDDRFTLNGAYGYRMQHYFEVNQLDKIINELVEEPTSRRSVITMYSPSDLNNLSSKDIPCNISIMFKIRNDALDMMVINRSNDIFYGIPYNFFVFQIIHYYVGFKINKKIGFQRHVTDSLHLYAKDVKKAKNLKIINLEHLNNEGLEVIQALIENYRQINARNFVEISDEKLRNFFMGYQQYKSTRNKSVLSNVKTYCILNLLLEDWIQNCLNIHH